MTVRMTTFENRAEWLKGRRGLIGGSDAAAVIGLNPYMTNQELWEIKTGRRKQENISDKPYVQYGIQAENHLRSLFALDYPQYIVHYTEHNLWTNRKYPFAHASLDGWLEDPSTGRKGILEIKTTEILRSMQKEKWKDQIPDNYYLQVIHYLMVTEFDFVILKAQLKTVDHCGTIWLSTRHYTIERTEVEDDIKCLLEAEKRFSEAITKDERPALILPEL